MSISYLLSTWLLSLALFILSLIPGKKVRSSAAVRYIWRFIKYFSISGAFSISPDRCMFHVWKPFLRSSKSQFHLKILLNPSNFCCNSDICSYSFQGRYNFSIRNSFRRFRSPRACHQPFRFHIMPFFNPSCRSCYGRSNTPQCNTWENNLNVWSSCALS